MDSDHGVVSAPDGKQPAPWLQIPTRAVSVVEHPCIIKNIDKGITSLGGAVKLSQGLRSKLEPQTNAVGEDELPNLISVSLRPDDPFAKRLLSTPVTTNNLLLKVTVPKRTGRRRKRGSSGPFVADSSAQKAPSAQNKYVDGASIFRRLQDNASKYTVSVAGLIDETHRFRTLPDIQYAASTNSIMVGIRDSILPFHYGKLKEYNLNTAPGADLSKDVGPPAEFIQMPVAYNYKFLQNSFVKYTDDAKGEINIQRRLTWNGYTIIKPNAETVPKGPKPNLPPETELTPYLQSLITSIRSELTQRPIITRHFLYNKIGWDKRDRIRQAAIYCGYFFETGPYREALIKWGIDPRTDPVYRKYQTVSFLSYLKTGTVRHSSNFDKRILQLARTNPERLKNEHIFDGIQLSNTGNLFQFCDITDPLLRRILDTNDIRNSCAPTSQGWYHIGTWAKATVIMKHKMNSIIAAEVTDDSIYERIVTWPELWDDNDLKVQYKSEYHDRSIHKERLKEHTVMLSVRWAAKNPRYAFERMEASGAKASGPVRVESPEDPPEEDLEEDPEEEPDVPEDLTEAPDTAEAFLNEGDEDDAQENIGDEDEDEDGEDEEESEGDDEDEDGEWEAEDTSTLEPAVREGAVGPLPFGGLYNE